MINMVGTSGLIHKLVKLRKSVNFFVSKSDITKTMHEIDKAMVDFQKRERAEKDAQPLHRKIINALVFWDDLDSAD